MTPSELIDSPLFGELVEQSVKVANEQQRNIMNSKQEKLTKIEEVIREVCPELTIPSDVSYLWGNTITTPTLVRKNENGMWETVGEKIHLEHILRAIDVVHSGCVFITISSNGFAEVNGLNMDGCKIDLTKPLHLQSDEFISWLYGVLVGE